MDDNIILYKDFRDSFKKLFYDESNPVERASFFWEFYNPMMSRILEDEKAHIHKE